MDSPIAGLRPQDFYRIASGSVLPRPIAWISTRDAQGVANLAPFSFFTVASIDPPVLAFSHVNRRDQRDKDTLANLLQGGDCVVHTVAQAMAEAMNLSSGEFPAECDEFALAGLAMADSHSVAAPSLRDAAVRFECRLREVVRFGAQPLAGQLVLLDVVHVSVDDAVLDARGNVDPARLDAVGKLGGDGYCTTHAGFMLARPVPPR
ncbi:flavin reductase family protein [Pseudoduganella sp. LjRoot289]|uniref:flavin reductase family protein n=1 Tax=Pseudoduganella sp. LjRoot289 TaxID=3342314 RepID=UPI003ECF4A8E